MTIVWGVFWAAGDEVGIKRGPMGVCRLGVEERVDLFGREAQALVVNFDAVDGVGFESDIDVDLSPL